MKPHSPHEAHLKQNPRSRANLRRGGIAANAEIAERARIAKERLRAEDGQLLESTREDPERAVLEVHAQLTLGVRRLMRTWLNKGGEPPPVLMDALREFRLASRDATEYLRARGTTTEAETFFATLDERVASLLKMSSDGLHPPSSTPVLDLKTSATEKHGRDEPQIRRARSM